MCYTYCIYVSSGKTFHRSVICMLFYVLQERFRFVGNLVLLYVVIHKAAQDCNIYKHNKTGRFLIMYVLVITVVMVFILSILQETISGTVEWTTPCTSTIL